MDVRRLHCGWMWACSATGPRLIWNALAILTDSHAQVSSIPRPVNPHNSQCNMTDLALAFQELIAMGRPDATAIGLEQVVYAEVRCPETTQVCSQALGHDLPCSEQGLVNVSNRAPKNASSKSFSAGPSTSPSRSFTSSGSSATVRTQPVLPSWKVSPSSQKKNQDR